MFQGYSDETFEFFMAIRFNNNTDFFHANHDWYLRGVREPSLALAEALAPVMEELDGEMELRPNRIVSRINRDVRFSRDKSPYRDHAWLGFKPPMQRTSECFVLYAEFERESYGYGMGMYAPDSAMMQRLRERMLARPERFLELVNAPAFAERFMLSAESYKRERYLDAPERLRPWLNLKRITFCYSSPAVSQTLRPEIADEIREAFLLMKPVYRFLMGLD